MNEVKLHDAETHLAEILDRALAGEDVVIARDEAHAVRLVPVLKAERAEFTVSNEALAGLDVSPGLKQPQFHRF